MSEGSTLSEEAQVLVVDSLCCSFQIIVQRMVLGHTEQKAELLKFIVEHRDVPGRMVESAVKQHLIELGKDMYRRHLLTGQYVDHLGSTEVFGYYLKQGEVPLETIKFEDGETAEEYIKSADGLLESVINQLLNYKSEATLARELVRY